MPRRGIPATSNCVRAASGKTGCWWRRCCRCSRSLPAKEARLLSPPRLRTGRESFPSSSSSISKAVSRTTRQQSCNLLAARYYREVDALAGKVAPVEHVYRHLHHLLYRFFRDSRAETPQGSLPACASGDVATRIRSITDRHSLFPTPLPAPPLGSL